MTPKQRALKRLSLQQRAVYEIICREKFIRASGSQLTTCKSMARAGLIIVNPESDYKNEFILTSEPVTLPIKCSHPLEVVGVRAPKVASKKKQTEIDEDVEMELEPKHISFSKTWARSPAVYNNVSREQHVDYWINYPI